MRRTYVIGGVVVWTVACVLWSLFFGPVEQVGYYQTKHVLWAVPVWIYLLVAAVWYGLNWINIINEWERRPVLLFGKYKGTYGPGIELIEPLIHTILDDVSIQDTVIEVGTEQQIQTKDNVGIFLDGVLTYRINKDKVRDSVVNVEDVHEATDERALSTLTDEGGKADLDRLLEHRDAFCETIKTTLASRVANWGVVVEAFELKSFKIADPDIEKAIAMKARAEKEGQAEIARAGMQLQVTDKLNEAAEKLTEKGQWLKGMEVLLELTRSAQNNTVLIPTDLTAALTSKIMPRA